MLCCCMCASTAADCPCCRPCCLRREKKGYSGVTTYCAAPAYAPRACQTDCLGGDGGPASGASSDAPADADLDREGRCVLTDHGAFVLINVYVPNAGDHHRDPQLNRPRLPFKLRFLRALRRKCDALVQAGRQVGFILRKPGSAPRKCSSVVCVPVFAGDDSGRLQHRRRAPGRAPLLRLGPSVQPGRARRAAQHDSRVPRCVPLCEGGERARTDSGCCMFVCSTNAG